MNCGTSSPMLEGIGRVCKIFNRMQFKKCHGLGSSFIPSLRANQNKYQHESYMEHIAP